MVLQPLPATEVAPREPAADRPPAWTEAILARPRRWTLGGTPSSRDFNRRRKSLHHTRRVSRHRSPMVSHMLGRCVYKRGGNAHVALNLVQSAAANRA